MKRFLGIVLIVAMMCCATWAEGGDEESSSSESRESTESNCPEKSEMLIRRAVLCMAPIQLRNIEIDTMTVEESRFFIKRYCYNRQPVRQCMQEVIRDSKKCYSEKKQKDFGLLHDFLEAILDVACSHYGETLAHIYWDILNTLSNAEESERLKSVVKECMEKSGMNLNVPLAMDLPQRIFNAYKTIKAFRECFVVDARELVGSVMVIDELLIELLGNLKCHDHHSDRLVPCKELDRKCLLGENITIEQFLQRGFRCVELNQTRNHSLGEIITIEDARSVVKDYCDKVEPMRHCVAEVVSDADKCFNETTREAFRVFFKDVEIVLDVGCSQNGKKFAEVFKEIRNIRANPEKYKEFNNKMDDCSRYSGMDFVREDKRELGRRIFHVYKTLKYFRLCVLANVQIQNVIASMIEIADLSREILSKMKCVHPQDNSVVHCKNLNIKGTENRSCSTYDEEKRNVRQILFDQGFQCISVKGVKFEHLVNDSSPEELQAFIRDYCRGLPRVADCLSEVSEEADVCLGPPPHRIFAVLRRMLEAALETGCSQGGERLATVFAGLQQREGASGEVGDAVYECVDMNVMRLKMVPHADDAGGVRVYREVEAFEECVVNGVRDPAVRNLTEVFLSDVMRELNCAETGDTEAILCRNVRIEKPDEDNNTSV